MKIITFLTDFGLKDGYVSQMKGVVSSITDARMVDITHEISPQNINQGAFILKSVVDFFPEGSVHVAVVDPGVGTNRKGLIISTKKFILVGPDNGLLIPAAKLLGNFDVYEITNKKYMNKSLSNTFDGRDVFSPVAAHISNGVSFEDIGYMINEYINLDFGCGNKKNNVIYGKIIHIDRFGNIITNICLDLVNNIDFGKKIKILLGFKEFNINFVKSYGFVNKNEILCTIGSGNYFEIGIRSGNAAKKLSVDFGDNIEIYID